uniref:Uncharacterized protein n=1 Tax=Tanacetum cinerariifolium TaxID=118510 RepID=A0A6L2N825_TANCI|nr:hypothetical protein [Tanacetum cinerariifolium]
MFQWVSNEEPKAPTEAPSYPDYVSGPEHPPSPDYVSGLEEPKQAPLSPDYVLEPENPEYLVPEEDPANYPVDGGDDADDVSSDDDSDDEEEKEDSEDEDKEKNEHLAMADSYDVPVDDPIPLAEDTEVLRPTTLHLHLYHHLDVAQIRCPSDRRHRCQLLLRHYSTITTYSTIISTSSYPSPPLPLPSLPTTSPTYAEALLGYKVARIRLRVASPSTYHPSEIPSLPLLLPFTTYKDDISKADMLLRKIAHFTTPSGRFEVRENSSAAARQAGHTLAHRVDYGFIDIVDTSICAYESRAMTAIGEVNERVTDLAATKRQDAQELYVRCEDAQNDRALLRAQVYLLTKERRYFCSMVFSYECEAVIARLTLRVGSRPWRPRLDLYRDMFRDLVCTTDAGPQDGPEDASSSC